MNVDYALDNGITSTINCLCLILVLCNVRECPVLRKYTDIYAKVFRISHTMFPTYSQMVYELYIYTHICNIYNMKNIYVYICISFFMRKRN